MGVSDACDLCPPPPVGLESLTSRNGCPDEWPWPFFPPPKGGISAMGPDVRDPSEVRDRDEDPNGGISAMPPTEVRPRAGDGAAAGGDRAWPLLPLPPLPGCGLPAAAYGAPTAG